ncbi:hypothetical protein GCM10017608_20020 [Agromyces luteolus]|nr:hypothetical protein GCM10017608_20020 [Agromyces luteolus]
MLRIADDRVDLVPAIREDPRELQRDPTVSTDDQHLRHDQPPRRSTHPRYSRTGRRASVRGCRSDAGADVRPRARMRQRTHTEVRMSVETVLWGAIFAIMAVGGVGLAACLWVFARAPKQ